jgi:MFS family permease
VALNSGLFNASRVVGPAIAGLLIAAVGTGMCFVVNAVSFLAVLVSLYLMRPEELTPVARRQTRVVAGIREGLGWARRDPLVRTVLVVVTVVSTVGFNFHVLVPLLASQTLDAGAETFGILSSAFGLGALVGALTTASLREASPRAFLTGAAGFSVTMLALALAESVPVALALLFVLGISFSLFTSSASALIQLASPDHLRGRVASLFLFAFAGLAPVGGLVSGVLAEQGGTPLAFGVAGIAGFVVAVWAFRQLFGAPHAASPAMEA